MYPAIAFAQFLGCVDLILFLTTFLSDQDSTRLLRTNQYLAKYAMKKHKVRKQINMFDISKNLVPKGHFCPQKERISRVFFHHVPPYFNMRSIPPNVCHIRFYSLDNYSLHNFKNFPSSLKSITIDKDYKGDFTNIPFKGEVRFFNHFVLHDFSKELSNKSFTYKLLQRNEYHTSDIIEYTNMYGFNHAFSYLLDEGIDYVYVIHYLSLLGHITVDSFKDLQKFVEYFFYPPQEGQYQDHLQWRYPELESLRITIRTRERFGCRCGKCKSTFSIYELVREMLCYAHPYVISFARRQTAHRKIVKRVENARAETVQIFYVMYNTLDRYYSVQNSYTRVNQFDISTGVLSTQLFSSRTKYDSLHDVCRFRYHDDRFYSYDKHRSNCCILGNYPNFTVYDV